MYPQRLHTPTSKPSMRVLISGAGIAGPTLAWFLARTGWRVTVVERASSILSHGQNVDLHASAVTVIKRMGLFDELKRNHTGERGTQFVNSKGSPYARFPAGDGAASPTSEFEILRGDLARLLYKATADHPNIEYQFSTTVKQIVSNDDQSVKVEFSHGGNQEYDLLVAADGQWSKIRKQAFPPDSVTVVDKGMFAVYWTTERLPDDNDWWNVYFSGKSKLVSLRPDPYNTIRAMFTCMPRTDDHKKEWLEASKSDEETQRSFLRREFSEVGWQAGRLLQTMDEAPDFYFQAVQQIRMSDWSVGRVVCLGDAGYAPTPLTGAGTSLAVIGAYVLAGELGKLGPSQHPSTALKEYQTIFKPYVEQEQNIPFFVPGIAHPDTATKKWLVENLMWLVAKIVSLPFLKGTPGQQEDDGFKLPSYTTLESSTDKVS